MEKRLSIVTNVSNADLPRIKNIIPSWLSAFGNKFSELLIIHDDNQLSGRISRLHSKFYPTETIAQELQQLQALDSRIRVVKLDFKKIDTISRTWFKSGTPRKCQDGSPIYQYIFAIDNAANDFVLKCDCDILFFDNGFIDEAFSKLKSYDLVSPPRNELENHIISSRAFFIDKRSFYEKHLPMKLKRLSALRIVYGLLKGKRFFDSSNYSIYYGFEDALNKGISNGNFKHCRIDKLLGNSLHVVSNDEAGDPFIISVVNHFVKGDWPVAQEELKYSMDYKKEIWQAYIEK